MDRAVAVGRGAILAGIRRFFEQRQYLEVETPILAPSLIPESAIEVFATSFVHPSRASRPLYLTPSPELWMKRLLARGWGRIFQITKAFRNAEALGRHHNPEFTMLEWYTPEAGYLDSLETMEDLLKELLSLGPVREALGDSAVRLAPPILRMSIRESFERWAGFDLEAAQEREALAAQARRLGLSPQREESWESLFNRIFVSRVEPELPRDRPLALLDYPAQVPCLARPGAAGPWRERWELYLGGIETANCFTEETDPLRLRELFKEEGQAKTRGLVPHEVDMALPDLYSDAAGLCSGVALGIDRLVMALLNVPRIEGVIFFPLSDILH